MNREYKPLFSRHGKEMDALIAINPKNSLIDAITDAARFEAFGITITITDYSVIKGNISVNMRKLFIYANSKFNSRYTGESKNGYEVGFSLDEYMQVIGEAKETAPQALKSRKNDLRKRIIGELHALQSMQLIGLNENQYTSISPICRTDLTRGYIKIEFSRPYAELLLKQPQTIINLQLMKMSGKNPTAFTDVR